MDNDNTISLRGRLTYHKSLHAKIRSQLTEERLQHKLEIRQLKEDFKTRESVFKNKISILKGQLTGLKQKVFGKSSESHYTDDLAEAKKRPKRNRGQQPGAKGHGRINDAELSTDEIVLSLPEDTAVCNQCGLPLKETSLYNTSEEITYEVILRKKRYIQKLYKPTCKCGSGLVSLGRPPRVMNKSKYSDEFWVELLLSKYNYQIPIHRLIEMFKGRGLYLSAGTLCGGIVKLSNYLEPLFRSIVVYNKAQKYRHFDETTLKVFIDIPDKKTKNWWLWQSATKRSVVFFLNCSRSANVVEDFLKDSNKDTVLITDRYSAYKKAKKKDLAFCWVHVRRDFIKVGRSAVYHLNWALRWLKRIGKLFKYNKERLLNKGDPLKYKVARTKVEKQLARIKAAAEYELSTYQCRYDERRKVIESLMRHWEGLTLFVNDDNIAMDNNFAERLFRPVATFRKSSYGTHSERFGNITAMLLSIFGTLRLNNIRPREYLREYFAAIAASPADLDSVVNEFVPWNLSEEKMNRLTYS